MEKKSSKSYKSEAERRKWILEKKMKIMVLVRTSVCCVALVTSLCQPDNSPPHVFTGGYPPEGKWNRWGWSW
jgi:hypothetical protein